jgi:hypothetical protein
VVLIAGCSGYYNGMYNADRFAGQARRAEREGRTLDATSLWGQVAWRAESALVRRPNSGWADHARLLQGTALAKMNDCSRALVPLEATMVSARNPEIAEQAALLVGTCRLTVGDPIGATSAYSRLTRSTNAGRRNLALWAHGRALRMAGNYEEALAELAGSREPRARGERAAALAALGRTTEALVLADSLMQDGDSLAPYDSLHAGLVRHDTAAATRFVDLIAASALPVGLRAALLLQDARRLLTSDTAAADRRLTEAQSVGRGTPREGEALLLAATTRIARTDSAGALLEEAARLDDMAEGKGRASPRAVELAVLARRVVLTADSTPAGTPSGDLRLFIAGELARDSLLAPRFAARQFRRIAAEWPTSEYAPKALLALIVLEPEIADSLRERIRAQYSNSPYVLLASGGDAPGYAVLEDSLRRFTDAFRPEGRRPPGARPGRPIIRPAQPAPPTDQSEKP